MPINVLVADDSATMRKIMELTLSGEDTKIVTVDSGDACIAKAAQLRPDVIFADATMATDGYAVAHAIRNTAGLEQTAVVVMASQKHPYDEARGRVAGVDDHILKPFDTQHVIDRVRKLASEPRSHGFPMAAPAAAPQAAAAPARMSKTQTIAFGKAPLPIPPMMQQPAGPPAMSAPQPSAQRTSVAHPPLQATPLQPLSPMQPMQRASAAHPAPAAMSPPQPAAQRASAPHSAATTSARHGGAATADFARKLDGLGLSAEQVEGVLALSREVIERVVWEVVPDLAETIIREELKRLTQ